MDVLYWFFILIVICLISHFSIDKDIPSNMKTGAIAVLSIIMILLKKISHLTAHCMSLQLVSMTIKPLRSGRPSSKLK